MVNVIRKAIKIMTNQLQKMVSLSMSILSHKTERWPNINFARNFYISTQYLNVWANKKTTEGRLSLQTLSCHRQPSVVSAKVNI